MIIDEVVKEYLRVKNLDYMSNIHPPSYPDGFDVEVFSFKALRKAHLSAKKFFILTPYIWDNLNKFKIQIIAISKIIIFMKITD